MMRALRRSSSTSTPISAISLQQALEAASLVLLQIPNQGRGLFPTTHIPAGHTILTESPLAAVGGVIDTHPKPSDTLYAACDWQPLHAYCMEQGGWRFPLLTAQLLCRGIMERSDVSMLCHANVPHPPPEWRHAHHLLTEVLTKQGVLENNSRAQEMVSWESYLGVLARCHINAFRIQHVSLFTTMLQDGLAAAASAAVAQDSGVHVDDSSEQYEQYNSAHTSSSGKQQGSALYWLASFFNHACSPNVLVSYPDMSATALFIAARDIQPYEQLTITYIDNEAPVGVRQEQLHFGYGFRCRCSVCVEELSGGVRNDEG